jgi:FkbM family methyltransferase
VERLAEVCCACAGFTRVSGGERKSRLWKNMKFLDLKHANDRAIEATRFSAFPANQVERCNNQYKYRGFVNCTPAREASSFVMFTNADDIVAAHYQYAGPASFETGTLNLWCHLARQSKWIYDIGAFTGVFALAAASTNPDSLIMAFEPSFVTYSRLLVNIGANGLDGQIAPMRFGVGASAGELNLRHASGVYVMASGESFLESHIADAWFTEKVSVLALDDLLATQEKYKTEIVIPYQFVGADLMKIDVEGFESEVLRGMQNTIKQYHPSFIVEVLDESDIESLLELFGDGYSVLHINERNGRLQDHSDGTNKLFIHRDRQSTLIGYSVLEGVS